MAQQKYVAYVGTYTHENSIGIHVYDIDMSRGRLTERSVAPISNPSNIVVSHSGKYLYSIEDEGIASFSIDENGDLTKINQAWIGGMRACYVEIDSQERNIEQLCYKLLLTQQPVAADLRVVSATMKMITERFLK